MSISKFYIVWRENGSNPTHKHNTLKSAKDEAERLALSCNDEFHVMESIGTAKKLSVDWTEHQTMPF